MQKIIVDGDKNLPLNEDDHPILMQGYLEKKEKRKTWIEYWATVQTSCLKLYTATAQRNLIGWIELSSTGTHCIVGRQSNGNFLFYVASSNRYLFRCNCSIAREKWMAAIGK